MKTILVINTGSTSTKVAVFNDKEQILQDNLFMPEDILKQCKKTVEQLPYRTELLRDWLKKKHYDIMDFDAIAARGGPLPPVQGGAYRVNRFMLDVLTYAPASRHESALACMIGAELTVGTDIPVYIYDSVSVDEFKLRAKYTGIPAIRNRSAGHFLNTRKVGKMIAEKIGKTYAEASFVIVHLGGSITVTAHDRGKITDSSTAFTGPMSTQRAGRIASDDLVRLCYSGKYTEAELLKLMNGGSGYKAYFGTQDARKVAELLEKDDPLAYEVTEALSYQTCKAVGEMSIACDNPVDRIIITGGMANFKFVTNYIIEKVSFIAPVEVLPGEYEMEALAEGVLDVLDGQEKAKEYDILPRAYSSRDEFDRYVKKCKAGE